MDKNAPSIMLLCENEAASQLDRRALRDAGFPVALCLHSGIEAAKTLAGMRETEARPDIVVCGHKLNDMDGEQFCAIIRQHPLLLGFPILLILTSDSEAQQLQTLGCGASALLGRPYSIDALKIRMNSLKAILPQQEILKKGACEVDTSAFDNALATYGVLLKPTRDPEDYFRVGMRCLEEHRWNLAISAFEHALRHAQVKAEAQLGMAAAFKGKGDKKQMQEWLGRAVATFVAARHWHHARAAYAKLLRHDPAARNPFISEAHKLIRLKKYDEAASVLAQGADMLPPKNAGDKYAQLCFAAEDPEAMLAALEAGFLRDMGEGRQNLAGQIRDSLDHLNREKDQRQRELAAERKWQLSRAKASQPVQAQAKPVELAPLPAVNLFEEESLPEETFLDSSVEEPADESPDLEPLTEQEATTELFDKKPKLNELLSVMKLTWKLARRKK